MIANFDPRVALRKLRRGKFRPLRDPRFLMRALLGVLLAANIVALLFLYRPWEPGPEELERRLAELRRSVNAKQASVERLRTLSVKSGQAREKGGGFMRTYFMDPRTASSTIISALEEAAGKASLKRGEHSYRSELIEGSETISMMTISGDYEGTYKELLAFVNLLDRSPLFLILESLTAAPEKGTDTLKVRLSLNAFLSERRDAAPLAKAEEEPKPKADQIAGNREADGG